MTYNWQQSDWPYFSYHLDNIQELMFDFSEKTGRVDGLLMGLPETLQLETIISFMVAEAVKTSAIEGEMISREDVLSSIRNKIGLNKKIKPVHDLRASGISDVLVDVRQTYKEPLTEEKLLTWHKMLFPKKVAPRKMLVGQWRTHEEPMQIVSGPVGKVTIHFEAPPSNQVPQEMKQFLKWFNATGSGEKEEIALPIVRAAIAHLYFETIHPFEDGNGRMGRAIAEKALCQGLDQPIVFSLSQEIEANRKQYYDALKKAQRSNDLSAWIDYFAHLVLAAQMSAEAQIKFIVKKSKFLDQVKPLLNERQLKVILKMLEAGPTGFEGGMSAKKYMAITQTSKATATRDLAELADKNVFNQIGSGRSTRYELNL